MIVYIPIEPHPCKTYSFDIEGVTFTARIKRNYISDQWFVDLDCESLDYHCNGFALLTGDNQFAGKSLFGFGTLVLLDLQGQDDPDYDGLGDRWKLYYLSADELE